MKTTKLTAVALSLLSVLFASCTKDNPQQPADQPREESTLTVNIVPDMPSSKAIGNAHGVQSDDNTVQTLEFFIFTAEGTDAGMLDTYKKYNTGELTSLSDLEIRTTTGKKTIYAVANSHKSDWSGIKTLADFKNQIASVQQEDIKNFTMVGSTDATLQATTAVTFSISRLVARVQVSGIKTDFAGTPYEGAALQNVKIYLINAAGDKLYYNGQDQPAPVMLNYKKSVSSDINGSTMTNMLYDEVSSNISDAGYKTVHSFYCYENTIPAETPENRFTKLVVQGDLNGHTYYYPVCINREGFGYDGTLSHAGVKRNTSYSVDITIMRPGSLNPDEPVEHSAMTATLTVANWVTAPNVSVIF